MSTNLKRRLDALESRLAGGEAVMELLGVRLTSAQLREILSAASGTSIGVDDSKARDEAVSQQPVGD